MRSSDRGSASIWLLGIGLAVVAFASLAAVAGCLLVTRHQARAAADLAALAGAARAFEGESPACQRAAAVARAQHAVVTVCNLEGLDLVVTVAVSGPAGRGTLTAAARAGPRLRAEAENS